MVGDAVQPTVVFGRIRGIPVGAHWTALAGVGLLAVLIATTVLSLLAPGRDPAVYATAGAATATAFVLSVLAHEIAHALVALRCGLRCVGSRRGCSAAFPSSAARLGRAWRCASRRPDRWSASGSAPSAWG
jgi:hypothetical protein